MGSGKKKLCPSKKLPGEWRLTDSPQPVLFSSLAQKTLTQQKTNQKGVNVYLLSYYSF